ncbi:MAG: sulfotransferase domain-containing protein [Rhodobacter sp.]|nr:sulfotransferase domain-containing protein [Rhodobacter sp.]
MGQGALEIVFDYNGKSHCIAFPEATADLPSLFVIGLPKAGSTLFNRIMHVLCQRAGYQVVPWHNVLRKYGIRPRDFPVNIAEVFLPKGYAYIGFRGLVQHERLPAFAGGRTVYLVRDPRDMVVSQYFSAAYSHPPPGTKADASLLRDFEATREKLQRTPIDDFVLETAPGFLQMHQLTASLLSDLDHRMWRYEDIVLEKQRWIEEVVGYLDLDVPAGVVRNVVARNDVVPTAESKRQHIRRVTPGDHRDKLKPETIARLDEIFAPVLTRYGYT